jgi:uncharacterized protein (DUF302 family)
MATNALLLVGGALIGMLIMGVVVWFTMPSLMLIKHPSKLGYDEALAILNDSLQKKPDWQLEKINDYQERTANFAALERTCSVNVCNPRYASEILNDDANRGVTAFMPLAIGIYEDKKGQVFVSQLNVGLLGMMFGGTIAKVMNMAGKDIKEVVASMVTK